MKTAVFLGMYLIARSISSEYFEGAFPTVFYGIAVVMFVIGDVIGFLADNGFIDWKNGDDNGY